MRLDLIDLRLFAHIHEAGTITAGAQASQITLPSASERLRAIEESVGVPLLSRGRKGITLTTAGRVLLRRRGACGERLPACSLAQCPRGGVGMA